MKKKLSHWLLAGAVISIASCSKSDNPAPPPAIPFTYSVSGVQDQMIQTNGAKTMALQVHALTGTPEQVTLVVRGLPAQITAAPAPPYGTPGFNSDVLFTASNATPGTYSLTLETTSASTQKQAYTFNLKVSAQPVDDCISEVVAAYNGHESCNQGTDDYSITVMATGTANKVVIGNLYNMGGNPYALLNCSNKTFTIPTQTVTGTGGTSLTYSGTGSYTANTFTVNYTITNGSESNSCTVTFHR